MHFKMMPLTVEMMRYFAISGRRLCDVSDAADSNLACHLYFYFSPNNILKDGLIERPLF